MQLATGHVRVSLQQTQNYGTGHHIVLPDQVISIRSNMIRAGVTSKGK